MCPPSDPRQAEHGVLADASSGPCGISCSSLRLDRDSTDFPDRKAYCMFSASPPRQPLVDAARRYSAAPSSSSTERSWLDQARGWVTCRKLSHGIDKKVSRLATACPEELFSWYFWDSVR
ncbi:hypothetical protein VTN00DRAFT_3285 [Thermoascus crustaceus]|uniref:uncharacterized protein n=1 Tax=Thermoascus crustaceus TaxID=5088 RepID=UPI0037448528